MSVFIGKDTRLVVQGITGRDGSFHAKQMIAYGTRVVAGVTPGKGGQRFEGAVPVTFGEDGSDDVYADMLAALETGEVDAVVDDDVVFVPLGENDPRFEVAFTVKTGNRWGIGVAKDRPELLRELDDALDRVVADRRHRKVWEDWLPTLDYPFTDRSSKGA